MLSSFLLSIRVLLVQKFISETLNLSSMRVSAILNALGKKKMNSRKQSSIDHGQIVVSLTGRKTNGANNYCEKIQSSYAHVFEQMGEEDTQKFIELMTKFMSH